MTTSDAVAKCPYCGMPTHQATCPSVKAFEYHPDGTIKRVEFKTQADYKPWSDQKSLFDAVFGKR